MDEQTTYALVRRLERLERQNSRMKRMGSLILIGIAAVVLMGQSQTNTSKTGKTVEAQEFIVRDADGKPRAKLTESGLVLSDNEGLARVLLWLGVDENKPQLEFYDREDKNFPAVWLIQGDDKIPSFLSMRANKNKDQGIVLSAEPMLKLMDTKATRLKLDLDVHGPSLNLYDSNENTRATLGSISLQNTKTGTKTYTSESSLTLFSKEGKILWQAP